MKRKLINFNVFERIEKDSLSSSERELVEAADVLEKALGVTGLSLRCFGPDHVMYETADGEFIYANYKINNNKVAFGNIEELVIDEQSEVGHSRKVLSDMIDALMTNENKKADALFSEYLGLPVTRRMLTEERKLRAVPIRKDGEITGYRKARWNVTPKHNEPSSKTASRMRSKKKKNKIRPQSEKNLMKMRRTKIKKIIGEWANLCENIFGYIEIKEVGPVLRESVAQTDDKGNVVAIQVPTQTVRNEAKLLSFNWKTLNTDVVVKRSSAKVVAEDVNFCKAVFDLKRQNALSDQRNIEEMLENIVAKWPSVLYLTETELAIAINHALEVSNATNYDDQTCDFMAEGILRVAHAAYSDRVEKILKLTRSTIDESSKDKYADFKSIVDGFYPSLDESNNLEMQVFVDLYEALRQIHEFAKEDKNVFIQNETGSHLTELSAIIQRKVEPSLEIAEAAAEWLWDLIETNLDSQDWTVSNTPHQTVNGDHPQMNKNASKGYTPSSDFSGNWGDSAPVSDGNNYTGSDAEEMRNRSWGNIGGDGTWPSLSNPYIPAPFGDYKIAGEKTIDGDSDQLAHQGGGDTWPSLNNPYGPKAETPESYKMNHGKEQDLVIDK